VLELFEGDVMRGDIESSQVVSGKADSVVVDNHPLWTLTKAISSLTAEEI